MNSGLRKSPLYLLVGVLTEASVAPVSWVSPAHSSLVLVFTFILCTLQWPLSKDPLSVRNLPVLALGQIDMLTSLLYAMLLLVIVATPARIAAEQACTVVPFVSGKGVLAVLTAVLGFVSFCGCVCEGYGGSDRWWSVVVDPTCSVPDPYVGVAAAYAGLVLLGGLRRKVEVVVD